jgi:predicted nucleic acid-binding protein
MARAVFVDSGAFYAAVDRRDARHADAVAGFAAIRHQGRKLFTSNLVVSEAHGLTLRRLGRTIAARWLVSLPNNVVFQANQDHKQALAVLARYQDQDFSYTDAVSFVIMERLGIRTAFAFDADFRIYGFEVIP